MICPRCSHSLRQARYQPGVILDVCPGCRGAWLDEGEAVYFTGRPEVLRDALHRGLTDPEPNGMECPRCRGDLEQGRIGGGEHELMQCTRCRGLWVDASAMGADTVVIPIAAAMDAEPPPPTEPARRPEPPRSTPTVPGKWLLGSVLDFLRDPIATLAAAASLGDVVRLQMAHTSMYLVNSPAGVKHVLADNASNYSRGRNQSTRMLRPFLGEGILTTDGPVWRARRRTMQPSFGAARLIPLDADMKDEAMAAIGRWRAADRSTPIDVYREALHGTVATTMRSLFGCQVTPEERIALVAAITDGQRAGWANLLFPFDTPRWLPTLENLRRGRRVRSTFARLAARVTEHRRAGEHAPGARGDLLDALLQGHASERQIRDEIVTMMTAAPENMAYTLGVTLWLLAGHPDVEARLRDEIDRTLGRRQPVSADLERMPYTACVLKETLRLYPGAYVFDRWVLHEDRVCGHVIPAGALVALSPYTMHRRPDLWPDPERFDPDRFAEASARDRPRYAYYPFGGGAHQCIGEHLALMQLRLVLPLVLQHLRFRRVPGHRVEHQAMFTLRPKGGIPLYVEAAGTDGRPLSSSSS